MNEDRKLVKAENVRLSALLVPSQHAEQAATTMWLSLYALLIRLTISAIDTSIVAIGTETSAAYSWMAKGG